VTNFEAEGTAKIGDESNVITLNKGASLGPATQGTRTAGAVVVFGGVTNVVSGMAFASHARFDKSLHIKGNMLVASGANIWVTSDGACEALESISGQLDIAGGMYISSFLFLVNTCRIRGLGLLQLAVDTRSKEDHDFLYGDADDCDISLGKFVVAGKARMAIKTKRAARINSDVEVNENSEFRMHSVTTISGKMTARSKVHVAEQVLLGSSATFEEESALYVDTHKQAKLAVTSSVTVHDGAKLVLVDDGSVPKGTRMSVMSYKSKPKTKFQLHVVNDVSASTTSEKRSTLAAEGWSVEYTDTDVIATKGDYSAATSQNTVSASITALFLLLSMAWYSA
jgi:hypothetical protein